MLGYFSIICLLRVHVLLGDFTLALKAMENVELSQKAPLTRVTACHVSTYYHVGFCYLALRRYPDAIRIFVSILNFISRMRRYHTRSYQYDQINKTADRMYALFALCNSLAPSRLDDNILNTAKERYGEQIARMAAGASSPEALASFEELFIYACPKFIAANPPPFDDPAALAVYTADPPMEPAQRHLALFLGDVRAQASAPTLRSFLKLYTSLDARKLAGFLDADEEEMVQQMMVLKQCSRRVGRVATSAEGGRGLLEGEMITTSDLDFVIDEVCLLPLMFWLILIACSCFRIWSTLSKQLSAAGMQDGSSVTQNMPSASLMVSKQSLSRTPNRRLLKALIRLLLLLLLHQRNQVKRSLGAKSRLDFS